MWIARDKIGNLWVFDVKPIRGKDVWLCDDINNPDGFINIDDFQSPEVEVTWENSPLELTIKTEKYENLEEIKVDTKDEELKCTFKPFDKVLVRDTNDVEWRCDFFERYAIDEHDKYPFKCFKYDYAQCIPYNKETEHLIRTTDEAPEKYVIWKL